MTDDIAALVRDMQQRAGEDRQLARMERATQWVRQAFVGAAGGQALITSPLDNPGESDAKVNVTLNPTVVHTATLTATAGQSLGASDTWELASVADDPEGPVGFLTSIADGFATEGWQSDITGIVVGMDAEWGWSYPGALSAGRFRTPTEMTVTRTRGGTAATVAYSDRGKVGPGGHFTHPGWTCEAGDIFSFATPHDEGTGQPLSFGKVTLTIIKTGVPNLPEAAPPVQFAYVSGASIGTIAADGTVTVASAAMEDNGGTPVTGTWTSLSYDGTGYWSSGPGTGGAALRFALDGTSDTSLTVPTGYGMVYRGASGFWRGRISGTFIDELWKLDATGASITDYPISGVDSVQRFEWNTDDGRLWIHKATGWVDPDPTPTTHDILEYNESGTLTRTIDITGVQPDVGPFDVVALTYDPSRGCWWLLFRSEIVQVDTDGVELSRIALDEGVDADGLTVVR